MRILILSSSTGGGHDMRARALESWCEKRSTSSTPFETFRYQALEDSAGIYKFGVGLYNWIQKKCPWLHHAYFNWLEVFQISASERLLLGKDHYIAQLDSIRPDMIVSVHAHTNHAFRAIAKKHLPSVKFVTYCGEMHGGYGFSRHWVDPGADGFIGATTEICQAAEALKMPKEKTFYGGFLLDPQFYGPNLSEPERSAARAQLDLSPDTFTLLLSTGANGALNHIPFLNALKNAELNLQVIALCGRNEAAKEAIETWSQQSKSTIVRALGYRADMFELMQISDAIVARPGTGTTSETILAGCPNLLNTLGGVMPQEWITVKYLRSNGLPACRIKRPTDLADQIRALIEHPSELHSFRNKMSALTPPKTPDHILDHILDHLKVLTEPAGTESSN